jgi:hypothetical protein
VASDLLDEFGRGMSASDVGSALATLISGRHRARRELTSRGRFESLYWGYYELRDPTGHPLRARHEDAEAWRSTAAPFVNPVGPSRHGLAFGLAPTNYWWPNDDFSIERIGSALAAGDFVSAVHYVTAGPLPALDWLWPLDVALFEGPESRRVRAALETVHWPHFLSVVAAEKATAPIELLVLPDALHDALARVLSAPRLPRVQAVLVLGGCEPDPQRLKLAEMLRARANADCACIATVASRDYEAFFNALLVELSHDIDFDVAVTAASGRVNAKKPLIVASDGGTERIHLSSWGRHLGERLARTADVTLPKLTAIRGESPLEIAGTVTNLIHTFRFDSERREASDLAAVGRALRDMPPSLSHRGRYLQALLSSGVEPARVVTNGPLTPGMYDLRVWIGEPEKGTILAPRSLPEDTLPPSRGHKLTVVMTTPSLEGAPQVRTIRLASTGPTERVSFELKIPEQLRRIEARISVLFENRILQTLLFSAAVGFGKPMPLRLALEGVIRRDLDGLGGRRPFDVALLANKSAGQSQLSIFAGDRANLVSASTSFLKCTQEISGALAAATNEATQHGPPDRASTAALLANLARKGVLLRDALYQMANVREEELASARRIQLVLAKADEGSLPIEICYDGAAPGMGAKTCPQWKTALKSGVCQPKCPADRSKVVCPVAFWGMSRAIERHAFSKADGRKVSPADYALQTEPADGRIRLKIAKGSLFAAAAKARSVNPRAVNDAVAAARKVAQPSEEVSAWAEWRRVVKQNPAVLVLLAHTDEVDNVRTLVIGKKDAEFITSVDKTLVGIGSGQGPIVLLLGCSTATTEQAFQSIVARFALAGASIVIGTLCEILGQHAAPIASELLGELRKAAAAKEGTPLGDLMPVLRRRLLARGYPIVMAIAPYGDADWTI